MTDIEMRTTWINDRWPLLLPMHRHLRDSWPWWEAGRLASMWHHLGEPYAANCYTESGRYFRGGPFSTNGEVVYDIGAEEGDFPALFSSWGCDVVLFEPNDRVWPNIKAIWEANGLRPPLAMFVGFAGPDDDGSVAVVPGEHHPGPDDGRDWPECAYGPVIGDHGFCNLAERPDIPRISIDALVRGRVKPPTAITIDCEGAEWLVLVGAKNVMKEHRPKIWVSVHQQFAREMYGDTDVLGSILLMMQERGYDRGTFIAQDHEAHWLWLPNEHPAAVAW